MTPLEALEDAGLMEFGERAGKFLNSFRWCRKVVQGHLAYGVEGVIGVFLFRIEPAKEEVDDTLWVIVGDLPSAYLVCDDAPSWRDALEGYVEEMRRWVEAVRAGESLEDIIPISAEPTAQHADMLAGRLDFIERHLIGGESSASGPPSTTKRRGI
jgi:hypothetical protein